MGVSCGTSQCLLAIWGLYREKYLAMFGHSRLIIGIVRSFSGLNLLINPFEWLSMYLLLINSIFGNAEFPVNWPTLAPLLFAELSQLECKNEPTHCNTNGTL